MLEIIDSIGGDVKDQLVFINTLKHYNEQKHKTVVPLVVDIGKLHLIFFMSEYGNLLSISFIF
jgi:ATP-dependent protease ClpP protease subunit